MKSIKGLTFYIAFGSYGGFHFDSTGICLGWVSIRILTVDIENVLENFLNEIDGLKEQKNKVSEKQVQETINSLNDWALFAELDKQLQVDIINEIGTTTLHIKGKQK